MNKNIKLYDVKPDDIIYRYIDLQTLMFMLESDTTNFRKVSSWEDTWENPYKHVITYGKNNKNGTKNQFTNMRFEEIYGQCWTSNNDSDAMWRIYSPNKDGIMISSTIEKLGLVEEIIYGIIKPITYTKRDIKKIMLEEILRSESPYIRSVFLKRDSFEHEKEIRFVAERINIKANFEKLSNNFISLKIRTKELIDKITIDPRATDWYVETIKKYCDRIGFNKDVVKSELYSPINWNEYVDPQKLIDYRKRVQIYLDNPDLTEIPKSS